MKIAINGIGIAGPTLAWWLRQYGHQVVLLEQAAALRTGGYVIDFWGVGYDVAEKMGILPILHQRGYEIQRLRLVNQKGRTNAGVNAGTFRALTANRFLSIPRGDIASVIFESCQGIESRFGVWIDGIEQSNSSVTARLSNGTREEFDLVVGADGLHSRIREAVFGPMKQFERCLGCYVAAFQVRGYRPRDELTYITHTLPMRQVARVSLRDDMTMFLFVFSDSLLAGKSPDEARPGVILREVFSDMQWEVPQILEQLEYAGDVYFDRVSQIRMEHWTSGRVALVGDAAACASLLAGEGTGLAMTEAYVLAGELNRARSDHQRAFCQYEQRLHGFLEEKQQSARRMIGFFTPRNRFRLWLRDLGTNLAAFPLIAKLTVGPALRDNIELPNYESD